MDPPGFALENFDALGRWRVVDAETKERIDASGTLVDGTKFDGPVEFRNVLLERRVEFVDTVVERLLTYALGRGTEYYDRPAIRKIVREAATERLSLVVNHSGNRQERSVSDASSRRRGGTAS